MASDAGDEKTGGAKKKPAPAEAASPPGDHRWIGNPWSLCDPLTDAEKKEVTRLITDDLTKGKHPVEKGKSPHLIMPIGPPGSGKSTIAGIVAEKIHGEATANSAIRHWPPDSYVSLDYDAVVKYHPRFRDIGSIPDVTGKPTGVGFALGWGECVGAVSALAGPFLHSLLEKRYNIILQTHDQTTLIEAKLAGYVCTLVYVLAPLDLCKKRARARAFSSGMFLDKTLEAQDETVENMTRWYLKSVPWYAMWADTLIIAPNMSDDHLPTAADMRFVDPHAKDPEGKAGWIFAVQEMYAAAKAVLKE